MTKPLRKNISEMISEFAGDFIRMGEDVQRRQINLQLVCTAWNLANLPKQQRKVALRKYVEDFRKTNSAANASAVEYNLKQLIAEKLVKFPDETATIVSAEYKNIEGKDQLSVASAPAGTPLPVGGAFRWN